MSFKWVRLDKAFIEALGLVWQISVNMVPVMALQKGDFILIDYIAKVKETGEVFDTTVEEIAKKERLYREGEIYEPKLVVVGEGWVLKALDESLLNMEVGKPTTVEIPPEKAFGPRDPEKVRRVPLRQLTSKGITPTLGMRLEYDGKMAIVRAIGAGRVLLDFNPPLAGKTLVYEVTVKKKLETQEEKIAALIHRRVPSVEIEKFKFTVKGKTINIEMPEDAFYLEGIQVAKRGIALDIQKFFPEITTVKFTETFKAATAENKAEEETQTQA
ncbi:MAG: FKBP-type peptidyl-prolyl cis-trans isomerase [Candidatus Bathyarchaeia archaeon]